MILSLTFQLKLYNWKLFHSSSNKYKKNYHPDRKQHVKLNYEVRKLFPIKCGVPQSIVVGPVLFTLYLTGLLEVEPKAQFQVLSMLLKFFIKIKLE